MKNANEIFDNLSGIFFKNLIESTNEKNNSAHIRLSLAAAAMLILVGAEAVKIVFRSNFGSKGISLIQAFVSFVSFIAISVASIVMALHPQEDAELIGSPSSFGVMGVFYGVLGIYILAKAIIQKGRAKDDVHAQYRGDSTILGFLMRSGWSQSKVQNFAEPFFTLALAIFLTAFNFLWGIPLAFCALSVWFNQLLEAILGVSHVRDVLAERGYQISREGGFSEVKH